MIDINNLLNKDKKLMHTIDARPSDAVFIGRAIAAAIGHDHCVELTSGRLTVAEVEAFFADLALRTDTQYSYLNSIIAIDPQGNPAGAIVGYDGGRLYQLRKPFLEQAHERFGLDTDHVEDETDASEFYLDTLYVDASYRRRGIGEMLIKAARERARSIGKPAGLLVDPQNPNARRLYEKLGFKDMGPRPFFGIEMTHMQVAD